MPFYHYQPRALKNDTGIWEAHGHSFKVYGIVVDDNGISQEILENARAFLHNDWFNNISSLEESDHLGFIIIHRGELGVSALINWWIQGSVLCQRVRRWSSGSSIPVDMSGKNVVACVWELGLINAEQLIWRDCMMSGSYQPDTYLQTRVEANWV